MQSALVVTQQVIVMFLLIGLGIFCRKKRWISEGSGREFCSLLLNIALPSVILNSLLRPLEERFLKGFLLAMAIAFSLHLLSAVLVPLLIRVRTGEEYRTDRFSAVYSNCAFMAFPLLRATVGEDGIFFATAFVVFFILFQWTHGIAALGGKVVAKKLLVNPGIMAVVLGLFLFFTQIPLPTPIATAISMVSSLNSPLSMILIGIFLAELPLSGLCNWRLVYTAFLRLLLLPLLAIGLLWGLGVASWLEMGNLICISLVIGFSCPTAVSVILMSAHLKRDVIYASEQVAVSTLLSIVSLPLIAGLTLHLFG